MRSGNYLMKKNLFVNIFNFYKILVLKNLLYYDMRWNALVPVIQNNGQAVLRNDIFNLRLLTLSQSQPRCSGYKYP